MSDTERVAIEDAGRRDFLKGALLAGGTVAATTLGGAASALAQPGPVPGTTNRFVFALPQP